MAVQNIAYFNLISKFPLRPLRTEYDFHHAIVVLDELTSRHNLTFEEKDYREILMGLVEAYDREHNPVPEMSPIEALRFLLTENGLTQVQLANETEISTATISEILNGKRGISAKVRAALSKRFRVSPHLFL